MRYILVLELKKAVRSRKNWLVLSLYTLLLVVFAASNMASFDQVRKDEIVRLETLRLININTSLRFYDYIEWWREAHGQNEEVSFSFTGPLPAGFVMFLSDGVEAHADSTAEFALIIEELMEAMTRNDRTAEVVIYKKALEHIYTDISESKNWRGMFVPWAYGPLVDGPMIDFDERDRFNCVRVNFIDHIVENNIHYLYRNEMTGFNFLYQAMLQFLPYIALIFVFLTICDVFTRENESGSYKFLLLQPISRTNIYLIKLLAAVLIASLMLILPLLLLFLLFGIMNGFGSPNYPVLVHADSYFTLNPLQNNLFVNERRGFLFYDSSYFGSVQNVSHHGYGYIPENASLGISTYSVVDETQHNISRDDPYYHILVLLSNRRDWTPWQAYTTAFIPDPELIHMGMLAALAMTLPLYLALLLFAASLSALIGVIAQNSTVSLTVSTLTGAVALLFSAPIRRMEITQRLNPYVYTNPLNIINGLGSTTALTGVLVLVGAAIILAVIGARVFSRRDIKC